MDEARAFGRRLREVRSWRGLTLREAAGLAGRSFSFWGQVERGERTVNSRNTLEAMAGALRVHPTGQPWAQQDVRHDEVQAGLEGIEIAMERYALGVDPEVAARPWPQIAEDLERLVTAMRWTADYAAQSELAPALIGELHGVYLRMPGRTKTSIALELGGPGQALDAAMTVHPELLPTVQQAEFWAVVGRALVAEKKTRDKAVRALVRAEQLAPQRIRHDVFVRDTVTDLLLEAGGRELRGLAWRMGIAPIG